MILVELQVSYGDDILNCTLDLDKVTSYRDTLSPEEVRNESNITSTVQRTYVRLSDNTSYYIAMPYSEFDALFKAVHLGKNWVSEYNFAGHNIISDNDMEVNYRVAELLEIEENEGLDRNTSL